MRTFRLPFASARRNVISSILLIAAIGVLAAGCARTSDTSGGEPIAQSVRAPMPTTRGDNLFEKEQTKPFPAAFLPDDAIVIEDGWLKTPPEGEEADLGYTIGEERFDTVAKLIAHLDTLDTDALAPGLILLQAGDDYRPDWKDDVGQLCVFAEFRNINLWFRAPVILARENEAEHAAWLVRQTKGQVSSGGADAANSEQKH